ncbi:nucleoside diphosphate kinase 3 isoform X2 [Pteropus vampyrus]|uniref:Nucleoside diphosphate kinase n=1 Tax=Pteropus vampyrus TaxID=132908 RepID=A0A6P3RJS3_PTEVA|nr:nucleoside diphosphate kinase 3 isoform X2 [Pteropus vampyrus]
MICLLLTIFANLFPAAFPSVHERTFLAVKPDGVQRRLVGEIVRRFERKGFKLVALKLLQASEELLREHYAELRERPFYGRLVKCGRDWTLCVSRGRSLGPQILWMPRLAPFAGISVSRNVIHGSDSVESARREIALWFRPDELLCWEDSTEHWLYE